MNINDIKLTSDERNNILISILKEINLHKEWLETREYKSDSDRRYLEKTFDTLKSAFNKINYREVDWTSHNIFGLEEQHYKLFIRVHKKHIAAMGTDNQLKYALCNVKSVNWDQEENCIKVYYDDAWWHYDDRGVWW